MSSCSAGARGGEWPRCGTRSELGLWANTPQTCAGIRSELLRSDPSSSGTYPAASAAAEPPEEPPGVRVTSHGLLVVPYTGLKLCQSAIAVARLVLPRMMAPACFSLVT